MSLRKRFLIVIVLTIITMAVVGSNVYADFLSPRSEIPERGNEIIITSMNFDDYLPSAAYNRKHNEYLVVWQRDWFAGPKMIEGARISNSGEILDKFTIASGLKSRVQPDVAYDPVNDRYLVVFILDKMGDGSNMDLFGRFIPWDGPNTSLKEFPICEWGSGQWNPKLAYARAEEEFLVVWNNIVQNIKPYISGRRITAANGNFPGSFPAFTISDLTEERINPDVAYNLARNEYLVVYDNVHDILTTRFTGSINHNFGGEFSIATWPATENHPAVAACKEADQYLVTWTSNQSDQGPTPNDAIYGRFIGGDGTAGIVKEIDDTTLNERESDVTCNDAGSQYLVAWQTVYTNFFWGIWGRLVDPNGSLDGTLKPGFEIVSPYSNKDREDVALAGGKISYLAVWEHNRDAYKNIHGRLMLAGEKTYLPLILR